MQLVLPAARSLRTLYTLASDKLWFAIAILSGFLFASKIASLLLTSTAPLYDRGFGL